MSASEKIPKAMVEIYSAITALTDAFSGKYLNSPEWTLPSRLADNPMVWMLEIDGWMIDIRQAPVELQQLAYEKGLIPFIPTVEMPG